MHNFFEIIKMKVICIIGCGKRKIWDNSRYRDPVNLKICIRVYSLENALNIQKNFINIPIIFYLLNTDFYCLMKP